MHAIASLLPHLSDGIQNYALCALLLSFHNVENIIFEVTFIFYQPAFSQNVHQSIYRTRTIITRGLYIFHPIFTPFFTAGYIVEQFIMQSLYYKKLFRALKSAVYNQERFQIKSGL